MRKLLTVKFAITVLVGLLVFSSVELFAQRRPVIRRTPTRRISSTATVERGTRIRVRMNETLNSKTAQVGDTFTTTVTEPVYSTTGAVVIPVGSTVRGRVNTVKKAKKGGDPGSIDVTFNQVRLPNGTTRSINGSLTDLSTKQAKSDNEGTASGDDRKNDKIIFIGGGAAGGAILGGAIGGGKGALIGGILGAAGGLLGERLTKGEDAEVRSGTEFGVYLNQSVNMPRYAEANTNTNEDYNPPPTSGDGRTYTVQPGDTLSKISIRYYGTSRRYMEIYDANRDVLSSPTSVKVGQVLRIP
ncbi:MAG: LysM peptidoglycan-binding domain-containing protein [Pyrinomonadaceae bacterium]